MAEQSGLMGGLQAWLDKHLVPVVNKITSTYWFSVVSDAVLYIVPFSMVSAIPSIWSIFRRFFDFLPDISALSTFSFGIIGLCVVFTIPYNTMVKEQRQDRGLIAGFTGVGTYMLAMNFEKVDDGYLIDLSKFGAGGMFTAIFIGLFVAMIYKRFATKSFFSEDSLIPDFVKNWFDNILSILICLLIAYLISDIAQVDLFTLIRFLVSPVTGFAQTLPGVIFMAWIKDFFYFFGISGWVFTPVTRTITQAAMAENVAALEAGQVIPNINAYGFSRYYMIGGEGSTLPLAIMLLFAKSKRNKLMGKATIVPSLFNINEPLVFSTIVNNPFMFIPMMLQSIILPANAYLWMSMGWAGYHCQMFDMNFLPNAVSAFFLANGNIGNAILCVVNLILATIIWYPFFRADDANKVEQERAQEEASKQQATATVAATANA